MHDPYWLKTAPSQLLPPLMKPQEVDVAIIGGGLTGLHAALRILEEEPKTSVLLMEAERVCSDASGRTMAKVSVSHSRLYPHFSSEQAKLYARANEEGFRRIVDLIARYVIACDWQPAANYIFASTEDELPHVRADYDAMKKSGLAVEWIEPQNEESRELPLKFLAGIRHAEQAVYHPRKFGLGLLEAIKQRGAGVYEKTLAMSLEEHEDGVRITTDNDIVVSADKAIVATRLGVNPDDPIEALVSVWRRHLAARSYRREPIRNAYIRYEPGIYSLRSNRNTLLFSGKDPKALPFEDQKHFAELASWNHSAFGEDNPVDPTTDDAFWWGEDSETSDKLPLIGSYDKSTRHTFTALGYSGWGMTKAAFAGIMLSDMVLGKPSPYEACFNPWRKQQAK